MKEAVETAEGRDAIPPQIPFKPYPELKAIHAIPYPVKGVPVEPVRQAGIFRTELPNEPRGSITFAEVIFSGRFHTWNVSMENGKEALELMEQLHAWHTHILTLDKNEVANIIARLEKLDLRNPKSQEA